MSELVLVNPRRKRRKATRRKATTRRRKTTARRNPTRRRRSVARRAAPARRRRRSVRRNPKLSFKSVTRDALIPAGVGAIGALGLDIVMGAVPIPAQFKTGPLGSAVKIVGAIVLGKLAGKMLGSKRGEQATVGAVTILAYGAVKNMLSTYAPGLPLSGSDFAYNPYPSMGEYVGKSNNLGFFPGGMGAGTMNEYIPQGDYVASDGMGEFDYM